MPTKGLVNFGAERGLFDVPEIRASNGGYFLVELAAVVRLVASKPRADLVKQRIVVGRKSIAFDEIDFARLDVNVGVGGRILALRFGAIDRVQVVVLLRAGKRLALNGERKGIVEAMLNASRIEMPISTYDPTGHFGRWNFPTSLTKSQALELARNPPAPGEALPIPPTR